MRYLDPKADITFKRVFGGHPDLVMSLLNALLPLTPEQEIEEVEYLSSEMVPDNPLRKHSIVDVRCKDKQGRQFLVEMQMIWSPEFKQRVLFNASKAYARQLVVGDAYELLQPVYSLNLVNDIFEPELEGFYHHYQLVHAEHTEKVIEGLQLVIVELPKFKANTPTEKKMQVLWLRFLTEISNLTTVVAEDLLQTPPLNKAIHELELSAFTDAELYAYEKFWDIISVEKTLYNSAERRGMERGIAKGLEKGIEKGIAEGIAKGMEKGLEKGITLIAANMKKKGTPPSFIAECTGLSLEEIEQL